MPQRAQMTVFPSPQVTTPGSPIANESIRTPRAATAASKSARDPTGLGSPSDRKKTRLVAAVLALTITALLTLAFFFFNGPVLKLEGQLVQAL